MNVLNRNVIIYPFLFEGDNVIRRLSQLSPPTTPTLFLYLKKGIEELGSGTREESREGEPLNMKYGSMSITLSRRVFSKMKGKGRRRIPERNPEKGNFLLFQISSIPHSPLEY